MIKLSPALWQQILQFEILDPDGWNRGDNFRNDWETPLTFNAFMEKADNSTCSRRLTDHVTLRGMAARTICCRIRGAAEEIYKLLLVD